MSKIDWTKWSAIAEILSALAIVGTLIYLAFQTQYLADQTEQAVIQTQQNNELLEQAQQIALSQGDVAASAAALALHDQIQSNTEVWRKGALEFETLSDTESVVFDNLVLSVSNYWFSEHRRVERISGSEAAASVRRTFSFFLYTNPGARFEWLAREDQLLRAREVLNPGGANLSEWRAAVVEDLEALDEAGF